MTAEPEARRDGPFLPTRSPHRTLETAEFWDACGDGRWVLPKCDTCAEYIWYPRLTCPFCGSLSVSYVAASGRGTVYTFTIIRRGPGPFREQAPYVAVMVRLDEGPVVVSNLVDVDPESVQIGDAVVVTFEPVLDDAGEPTGDAIYRFCPA
jgi:uncharacterized protein